MKVIKSIIILLLAAVVITSCQKEDTKVTFLGGNAPVLTVSSTDTLTLLKTEAAYQSLQFQWTNPDYQFSNGVNTQDVYYTLQIDTLPDFSSSVLTGFPFVGNVSHTFTVKELNTDLGQLQLLDGVFHKFYFRITASMASDGSHQASGSVLLTSNVVSIVIKTYLDVVFPVPDSLFITGSATPAGWQAGTKGEAIPPHQQFKKVNSYLFQIDSLQLTYNGTADSDNGFLFLPKYGNWNDLSNGLPGKYGFTGSKHANNGSGDFFEPDGNDFAPPSTSGNYKIVVNFKTGKYTMTQN